MLTYPLEPRARKDATFYDSQFDLVPTTQEKMFYDSVYGPMQANFWGKRHVN